MINEELMYTRESDELMLEEIIGNKIYCDEENRKQITQEEMIIYPMRYTEMINDIKHVSEHKSINRRMDEIRLNAHIHQR